MARYWVSLGQENPDGDKREKRFEKELEKLANHFSEDGFGQYSYVDAKNVAKEAVEVYKKYGFEDLADGVYITTQPECPK
jgi:hypothetical protein